MSDHILNEVERSSSTWVKVARYMETRLTSLRSELESDKSPEATAKLRGEIKSLKNTLALGSLPAPAIEAEND